MDAKNVLLLTGATGMIGGALLRAAWERNSFSRIVLPVRNIDKAKKIYHDLQEINDQRLDFVETQIEDLCTKQFPMPVDYIIHCACVTQSKEMVTHPVETADSIVMGTKNILELAKDNQVRSMVYLSSMEVYGKTEDTGTLVREDQLGEIDLKSARSSYPMGKRMAEHYCYLYQQEYGVPVKIARLAQTFGKGVSPEDKRVYAQFARAVEKKENIVLKTQGTSMGNYCSLDDVVEGIFFILNNGQDGEAYNVVNEANTMRICEMAELVAKKVAGGSIKVTYDVQEGNPFGYAPDTGLRLSGEKLRRLGWEAKGSLEEMYCVLLRDFENCSVEGYTYR